MDGQAPGRRQAKLGIRGVSKRYRSVVAVDDVSLEVADGEFLTLLGPSGSGKTTLLTIVAGLAVPDQGEVWIDGRLATYMPPYKRDIGMVFQNYALFPHLTVFENIAFPLRMRRTAEAEIRRAVGRVLEIVALPQVADRLPRQLSGGQQQRIALARCMVYQPSIIVMDEPLGALDKGLRDAMQLEIKRLHEQFGITVLYVTHDQEEALALSDRICVMRHGRIDQIAAPHELYFQPATLFVAGFVGDSNLLAGMVRHLDAGCATVEGPGGGLIEAATRGRALTVGQPVTLMIRPESLHLTEGADAPAGPTTIAGVVESVLFAGSLMKLFLRCPDGRVLQAKLLARRRAGGDLVGKPASVSWSPRDVVLFDEEIGRDG